jgi:hypothetical protein
MALPQEGTWTLPDGRVLHVALQGLGGPGEGRDQRRGWCECHIPETPKAYVYGSPLPSSLAALLGYEVGLEEWPDWIDQLAEEIEADLRGKWKASILRKRN